MAKFGWKAVYGDGVIKQYPLGRAETNFGEVRARGLPLKFFVGGNYGVNLSSGELLIKGVWTQFGDRDGKPFKPEALVYFRRNLVRAAPGGLPKGVVPHQIWHFLGYTHEAGIVRLCIPDDGSKYTVCVGIANEGPEHMVKRPQNENVVTSVIGKERMN